MKRMSAERVLKEEPHALDEENGNRINIKNLEKGIYKIQSGQKKETALQREE